MGIWLIMGIFVIGGITGIAVGVAHILNKGQERKNRKKQTMLNINDKAPNFNLKGNDNKSYSLESFENQKLIIYFYPKDNTPGCTLQGIEFTQYKDKFKDLGYKVIGVSNDSYETHCKFATKHNIGILLLSDDDKKMSKEYSVLNKLGIISRSTFILNEQHVLMDIHYGLSSKGHVESIYNSVKKIENIKEI